VFTAVGVAGFALQTAALWLLVGRMGLPAVPATLMATEAAVLHNFAWHVRWTWADRPSGPREMAMRLLRFNVANGGVSLAGGAALMALLVDALGVHYLLANVVAVVICSAANYLAGDRWVFRRPKGPAEGRSNQMT
jgi:putative flippase GtrA